VISPVTLWIDPGGQTGLGIYFAHNGIFEASEHPFFEACSRIEEACYRWMGTLAIGWERYTPRRDKPQTHAADALTVIGVARYVSLKHRCLVLPEADPMSPKTADRLLLTSLGWWVPGKDDAQSAANHMLKWMLRSGNLPPDVATRMSVQAGTVSGRRRTGS
jgi:hypothetical protein